MTLFTVHQDDFCHINGLMQALDSLAPSPGNPGEKAGEQTLGKQWPMNSIHRLARTMPWHTLSTR